MKDIKTVGVIGLGALGTMYAAVFTAALGKENVLILADAARAERLNRDGMWLNGEKCDFNYVDAAQVTEPVDLLIFAVKSTGLSAVINTCRHLVGPETTLMSVLNGVSSEELLAETFGAEKVVWCVCSRASVVKEENRVTVYTALPPSGHTQIGIPAGHPDAHYRRLTAFFDAIDFHYWESDDILSSMWGKMMCNTGCNQAAMVFECTYSELQRPGKIRDTMIAAMEEVIPVANAEGVPLNRETLETWVGIIDSLDPTAEPSMRQDGKARRKSEVDLFAGTVCRLGKKHDISVPVNEWIYQRVTEMESTY